MAYKALRAAEKDFGPENNHRLATQSASQYLSTTSHSGAFSTGSKSLDDFLGGNGLLKGQMLEISGPPGSGKTALGIQLVASAARKGSKSCWIDTSTRLPMKRISCLLQDSEEQLSCVTVRYAPSLAHLYALLKRKQTSWQSADSQEEILVIDDISTAISREFSFAGEESRNASKPSIPSQGSKGKLAERKQRIIGELMTIISKLAGHLNMSVVVMTQLLSQVPTGGGRLVLFPSTSDMFRFWSSSFHYRFLLVRKSNQSSANSPASGISRVVLCLDRSANFLVGERSKLNTVIEVPLIIKKDGISDADVYPQETGMEIPTTQDDPLHETHNPMHEASGGVHFQGDSVDVAPLHPSIPRDTAKRRKLDDENAVRRKAEDRFSPGFGDSPRVIFDPTEPSETVGTTDIVTSKATEMTIPDSDDDEDEDVVV